LARAEKTKTKIGPPKGHGVIGGGNNEISSDIHCCRFGFVCSDRARECGLGSLGVGGLVAQEAQS
jgi:hypothetical protein